MNWRPPEHELGWERRHKHGFSVLLTGCSNVIALVQMEKQRLPQHLVSRVLLGGLSPVTSMSKMAAVSPKP